LDLQNDKENGAAIAKADAAALASTAPLEVNLRIAQYFDGFRSPRQFTVRKHN
jgi:hypothetical protein